MAAAHRRCRKTSQCNTGETCDANHFCREMKPLGRKALSIDYYRQLCTDKFIPLVYERHDKKGMTKDSEALRRCNYQPVRPNPLWDSLTQNAATKRYDNMNYQQLLSTYNSLIINNNDFITFMKRRKKVSRPSEVNLRAWLTTFKSRS